MLVPLANDPLIDFDFMPDGQNVLAVGRTDDDGHLVAVDIILRVKTLGSGVQRMGYRLDLDEAPILRDDLIRILG